MSNGQVGNWQGFDNSSVATKLLARDPHEVHAVRLWVKEKEGPGPYGVGHGGDTLGLVIQTGLFQEGIGPNKYHQVIWRPSWGRGYLGNRSVTFGEAVDRIWTEHLREEGPSEGITHKTIGGVRYEVTENDLPPFTSFAEHLKKRDPS